MFISILKNLQSTAIEEMCNSFEPSNYQINLLIESHPPTPTDLFVFSHANISPFEGH